jgi:hypothetical protein
MERRTVTRRVPFADEPLSRVRLRTGRELLVVNVSNTGLLVEGTLRLLPGTHVDVHVVTPGGRVLVRSRIVRAYVFELQPDTVRYRGALAFERTIDTTTAGYGVHGALGGFSDAMGTAYPAAMPSTLHPSDQRLIA